ncbi:hypothetical protein [Streptomyces sp. NBC_01443]|uniref:hypothetical protein n=1 Tax=Streptomyces sp. NBC_01443 TaxID=2903868 RepID=UPI00224FC3C9|nr:hypothetical protein [Streptomyces sp. NBC_01443]MCX4633085.1 hypothetical protein [Streptomyces sp. NBC_01443]
MIVFPDGSVPDAATHPDPPAAPPTLPRPAATPTIEPAPASPARPPRSFPRTTGPRGRRCGPRTRLGDLPTAVVLAHRLEAQLEAEYGPSHSDTITVLSARAWLTLIQRADPRGTAELLLTTALRRQAARARPELETARAARNAHAVWRILCDQDPEGAREMAERPRRRR